MAISFHVASVKYVNKLIESKQFDTLISICHPNGIDDLPYVGTDWAGNKLPHGLVVGIPDNTPFSRDRKGLGLPTGEQVLRVIEFARSLPDGAQVLLHCKRGRSRSPAVLLTVLAARGMMEKEAVRQLLTNCPKATPNGWILKLADAILDVKLFHYASLAGIVKWK